MSADRNVNSVGATASIETPRPTAASRYAMALANVNAISWTASEPDSRMWYPETASGTQRGTWRATYSSTSTDRRREGAGGKICVPLATYSLSTSFWMKIPNAFGSRPRCSARATNIAAQM